MSLPNYTRALTVAASPEEVFSALTEGFEHWWTKPSGPISEVGDLAKFTFPPGRSYWTFEAVAMEPSRRVELVCVDALHLHEGQPAEIELEWLKTRLVWQIEAVGRGSGIRFEHRGLRPDLLCYEVCEAGWDMFFVSSLKAFLNTGTGHPHRAPDAEPA
ncbi:hypothetical protein AWH62_06840 [Maricaulis sp. W15]|uniref:SRPBCC family protein n=1 Tax=Maricaulis sp. W15 TaxID=1772333 RepID=UPI000948EA0F|nr:SRPBCC domain-containing protein [Maricaulis sp. W15]OLF75523.1 hypothetical protein AWH62_06840 [Maricaulis sp. W15]